MIKVISIIAIIGLVFWGLFEGWSVWDKYNTDQDLRRKELLVSEQALNGMPQDLEESYTKAKAGGMDTFAKWLRANGLRIQDPRRAWVEMEYMVMISTTDPAEAKRIFADVKGRTPTNSPVYPRVQQLEKTYQ